MTAFDRAERNWEEAQFARYEAECEAQDTDDRKCRLQRADVRRLLELAVEMAREEPERDGADIAGSLIREEGL